MTDRTPSDEPLLTSGELAAWLKVSARAVYRLVQRGLPCVRLGTGSRARLRFVRREVIEWLRYGADADHGTTEDARSETGPILGDRQFIR